MENWIAHQQYIRRFNMTVVGLFVVLVTVAALLGGLRLAGIIFVVELVAGGLFIGMANVALLLGTPSVNATEDEIRTTAADGPKWLKRLVAKLDSQP